jgi:hypothetical protein
MATPKKKAKPLKNSKKKPVARKLAKKAPTKKRTRSKTGSSGASASSFDDPRSRSATQSGDLQGLSTREAADSESVDELLEEGNAFEADVVSGVESADNADEQEVHTHEVPEDDVPGEYLDED